MEHENQLCGREITGLKPSYKFTRVTKEVIGKKQVDVKKDITGVYASFPVFGSLNSAAGIRKACCGKWD